MARKTVVKTRDELAKAVGKSVRTVAMYIAEGMPGTPGHYVVEDCLAWIDARENKRTSRDTDDLPDDGDSPALERYRLARAQMEELKLARLRSELVESEHVQQWLQSFAGLLRGFGEKVAKVAPELVGDLDGVLEQAGETLDKVVGAYGCDGE